MSYQIKLYSLLVFCISLLIFNLNFRTLTPLDTVPARLLPFNILMGEGLYFDKYIDFFESRYKTTYYFFKSNNHIISHYPIMSGILSLPVYTPFYIVSNLSSATDVSDLYLYSYYLEKISASILTSLTVVLLFLLLQKVFKNIKLSVLFSFLYAFATPAFSINSQGLWQHTSASLFMILSQLLLLYGLEGNKSKRAGNFIFSILAGLLSVFSRPVFFIFFCILNIILFLKEKQNYKKYLAISILGLLLIIYNNLFLYKSSAGAYGEYMGLFNIQFLYTNFLGLIFSPARGLIVYSPILLISLVAYFLVRKYIKDRIKGTFFYINLSFFVLGLILISFWKSWWGGHSWGGRLASDIAISGIILCSYVYHFRKGLVTKIFILSLAVISIFSQAIGVFYNPTGIWDSYPSNVDTNPARLWSLKDNPIFRNLLVGPDLSGIYRNYYYLSDLTNRMYLREERKCKLEKLGESNILGYKTINLRFYNLSNTDWLTTGTLNGAYNLTIRQFYVNNKERKFTMSPIPANLLVPIIKSGSNVNTTVILIPPSNFDYDSILLVPVQDQVTVWEYGCSLNI